MSCLVARGDRQLSRRPHGRCPLVARVTLASANVQTLLPHQGDRSYAKNTVNPLLSKVEALETRFVSRRFDVVGVHEGSARCSGERIGTKYRMPSAAAASEGSLGIQLWIRLRIRARVMLWREVNPRLMWASIVLDNGTALTVVVAHAPHMGADAAAKTSFWATMWDVTTHLRDRYPEAHFRVLVDANGRVGSVPDACIGAHDAEAGNEGAARLRSYASAFTLCAVNTFWPAGRTWCSTLGARRHIEYILSDAADAPLVDSCFVASDVDLTFNAYEDHKPVVMRERLRAVAETAWSNRHAPFRIDRSTLQGPVRCDKFQQGVWVFQRTPGAPLDHWLSDLTDHVKLAAIRSSRHS